LSSANHRQLFIPIGFGHAFLALSESADVEYKCSGYYAPPAEGTIAWNDPDLGIAWPCKSPVLSSKDRQAMSFSQYRRNPAFRYEGNG
jgi:dTDP-4-dehydrorhamnose 3,5-epimerase